MFSYLWARSGTAGGDKIARALRAVTDDIRAGGYPVPVKKVSPEWSVALGQALRTVPEPQVLGLRSFQTLGVVSTGGWAASGSGFLIGRPRNRRALSPR